jgi:transcriptional regulator with XRE-family HTH domain
MGTQARARPKRLAKKLLAIRKQFDFSQSQLVRKLDIDKSVARISEWESGVREPDLLVLLSYARAAKVCTCVLIDDDAELSSQPHKKPRYEARGRYRRGAKR